MNRFEAAALVRVVAKFELERQKLVAEYDDDVVKLVLGDPE